jgi:hypothetical protein
MRSDAALAAENARSEEPHRQHRLLRPPLPDDERNQERCTNNDCCDDLGTRPTMAVAVDEPPDEHEQADTGETEAGQVERLVGAV